MKKLLFIPLLLLALFCKAEAVDSLCVASSSPINKENCSFKDTPLYGRVKIVNSFADFQVRVVDSFSDLDVKVVTGFANSCGEWIFVDSFEDFSIRFVDSFEDFSIRFVDSFPGVR